MCSSCFHVFFTVTCLVSTYQSLQSYHYAHVVSPISMLLAPQIQSAAVRSPKAPSRCYNSRHRKQRSALLCCSPIKRTHSQCKGNLVNAFESSYKKYWKYLYFEKNSFTGNGEVISKRDKCPGSQSAPLWKKMFNPYTYRIHDPRPPIF